MLKKIRTIDLKLNHIFIKPDKAKPSTKWVRKAKDLHGRRKTGCRRKTTSSKSGFFVLSGIIPGKIRPVRLPRVTQGKNSAQMSPYPAACLLADNGMPSS
jgi:hypothetical protein